MRTPSATLHESILPPAKLATACAPSSTKPPHGLAIIVGIEVGGAGGGISHVSGTGTSTRDSRNVVENMAAAAPWGEVGTGFASLPGMKVTGTERFELSLGELTEGEEPDEEPESDGYVPSGRCVRS